MSQRNIDDDTYIRAENVFGSTAIDCSDEPPLEEGAFFVHPRYVDQGRIASGAFGDVRRVKDTESGQTVAMKVMRPNVLQEPRKYTRFIAEVEFLREFEHPGILPVHDYGAFDDGRVWFTMPEVRGPTYHEIINALHSRISRHEVSWIASDCAFRRALEVLVQLSHTVEFAHDRGIVHRDLKPTNLMTGAHGEAFVMDWGIAKRLRPQSRGAEGSLLKLALRHTSTKSGEILGTPAYMPPEQAVGDLGLVSFASDVYSLGANLFHLLAGVPPYRGARPAVLAQLKRGAPRRISEVAAMPVPEELVAISEHAMQRAPSSRHASVRQFAMDVSKWLHDTKQHEMDRAFGGGRDTARVE